jgi:hypothetical protein
VGNECDLGSFGYSQNLKTVAVDVDGILVRVKTNRLNDGLVSFFSEQSIEKSFV